MAFDLKQYRAQMAAASDFLRNRIGDKARIGLILGTGLGALADEIDADDTVPYDQIPSFPLSTVESHHGKLIAGRLAGVPVIALQGRFHLYEGYSAQEITLPVRVMASLGVETLLISNAAGGMNPHFRKADLMVLADHINLQGANPLSGPNDAEWGPRFPDMSAAYDPDLQRVALDVALARSIKLQQGVYAAVAGPNLETRSEYRMLRTMGADAVGMSTVPEVIVARHMGLRCMAISVITDECFPDALEPVSIEDVLAAAAQAEPKLTAVMKDVVKRLGGS
ncbi:purine-nucleoside phosphorylase [soil metagenome]